MILASVRPGNTADADMKQWPLAVEELRQFAVDVVIPGHGDRLDPGLNDNTLQVLAQHSPQ